MLPRSEAGHRDRCSRGVPFHRRNFPQGTVGSRRKGHECFLRRVRFLPDSLKTGISSGWKNSPSAVREPSLFLSVRELCRDEVPQERQELLAGNEEGGRGEDEMKTDGLAKKRTTEMLNRFNTPFGVFIKECVEFFCRFARRTEDRQGRQQRHPASSMEPTEM